MSWARSGKRLLQFAILALSAGELSYAAAEVLILRADGPTARRQFRIGARVPDSAMFTLRPGERLTVLARGGTRSFRGPGTFSVTVPPRGYATLPNGTRVRIQSGAVRDPMRVAGVDPTEIWEYDSREAGNVCVPAGGRPVLWRPADHSATRLTITTLAGAAQSFDWPAGRTSLTWPESVPFANGSAYTLSWNSGARPARITTIVLAANEADNLETLAATLIRNQCLSQLDTFIATRADPDAPPASGARSPSRH